MKRQLLKKKLQKLKQDHKHSQHIYLRKDRSIDRSFFKFKLLFLALYVHIPTYRNVFDLVVSMKKTVSLIIPAYNESRWLAAFCQAVYTHLTTLATYDWEIIIINDWSKDDTWDIIDTLSKQYPIIKWINFSRNFGKEIAISAWLQYARGDAAITIDADGQHPIDRLGDFLEQWELWYEIVYNRRPNIAWASYFKRLTSKVFYALFNMVSEFELESKTTDYRLLDRKVIDVFLQFTEKNRFYRWLIDRIGFSKKALIFDALPNDTNRKASYNYSKLTKLAIDSITWFSVWPLRLVGYLWWIIVFASCFMLLLMVTDKLIWNHFWFSNLWVVVMINTLLVGIVMISLWLMAIYIAQIHEEVKWRPLFIVKDTRNLQEKAKKF